MYNGLDIERIVAREKQLDMLRQVEQDRMVRLARSGRKTRPRAGRRPWDRLVYGLLQFRLCSRADPYLLRVSTCGWQRRE